VEIDSHAYGITPEGKSIARIPDGGDIWYDPIPTPGEPNEMGDVSIWENLLSFKDMEKVPQVDFYFEKAETAVGFKIINIKNCENLEYEVLYKTNGLEKGIVGVIAVKNRNEVSRNGLILGTCSKGVCVYDKEITEIKLNITLIDKNGEKTFLNKEIAL